MKATVVRKELKDAVSGMGRIVGPHQTIPVLGHVRICTGNGSTVAQATDLSQTAEYRFNTSDVFVPGECIVPLKELKPLTKGPGSDVLQIYTDADSTNVTVVNPAGGYAVAQNITGMKLVEPGVYNLQTEGLTTGQQTGTIAYNAMTNFINTNDTVLG